MEITVERLEPSNWAKYCGQIRRIEEASYEESRRDLLEYLRGIVQKPCSECFVALQGKKVVGFCFGASLETFPNVEGTRTDPEWNKKTTFYSADVTVDSSYRRKGIAAKLKQSQLDRARSRGYRFVAGRNRLGVAAADGGAG